MNQGDGIEVTGAHGLVLVSCPPGEVAAEIAGEMIERRLAACVQILPGIRSLYRWKGSVHEDAEILLLAKTRHEHIGAIADLVKTMHPYEVPELIYLPVTAGSTDYLRWVSSEVTDRPNPTSPASGE